MKCRRVKYRRLTGVDLLSQYANWHVIWCRNLDIYGTWEKNYLGFFFICVYMSFKYYYIYIFLKYLHSGASDRDWITLSFISDYFITFILLSSCVYLHLTILYCWFVGAFNRNIVFFILIMKYFILTEQQRQKYIIK